MSADWREGVQSLAAMVSVFYHALRAQKVPRGHAVVLASEYTRCLFAMMVQHETVTQGPERVVLMRPEEWAG